mgnify:CR=1 FL=1
MLYIYINMYEYIHTDVNINRDLTSHNTHMHIYIASITTYNTIMIHKNQYVVITIYNKYTIATTQVNISRQLMTCCLKQHHCYYQRASKSSNTGPMGSCVSIFHTLCIPYTLSPKSISFHNWFLDNNTVDGWKHKFSVLNNHF